MTSDRNGNGWQSGASTSDGRETQELSEKIVPNKASMVFIVST